MQSESSAVASFNSIHAVMHVLTYICVCTRVYIFRRPDQPSFSCTYRSLIEILSLRNACRRSARQNQCCFGYRYGTRESSKPRHCKRVVYCCHFCVAGFHARAVYATKADLIPTSLSYSHFFILPQVIPSMDLPEYEISYLCMHLAHTLGWNCLGFSGMFTLQA